MNEAELKEKLVSLAPWHFDVEVAPGIKTSSGNVHLDESRTGKVGVVRPGEMETLLQSIYPDGLQGRSFLDVGCNGGAYCFIAHRLGAGRVLGFDVRDHWINQANFLKSVYGLANDPDIQFRVCHMEDLETDLTFDVSLFKGVFYHVPDPIHELRRVCDRTNELIIIDTITQSSIPENGLMVRWESTEGLMSGVDALAWAPGGPAAVQAILKWRGFTATRVAFWEKLVPPHERRRGRMRLLAAKDESVFAAYDASRKAIKAG